MQTQQVQFVVRMQTQIWIVLKMQTQIQLVLKMGTRTQAANDQMIQIFIATASTVQT